MPSCRDRLDVPRSKNHRSSLLQPKTAATMTPSPDLKRRAAMAAIELLPQSGTIGLGTGSTAEYFIERLAALVREGRKYIGVPTSKRSRAYAESLGIPMLQDEGPWHIDITVDGADEVSESLDLIKGGGGCHLQEKLVNDSSRMNVIVVDESKLSPQIGRKFIVPVEVIPFGHRASAEKLQSFGEVTLRMQAGKPFVTDSGNLLYDVRTGEIAKPSELDWRMRRIPGVVETGLFVGRADLVIVAGSSGTRELRPPRTDTQNL